MTKHWVMYILATVGLTALVLWLYKKFGSKAPPLTRDREPIVNVSTDDPNMIVPDWSNTKPVWDINIDDNRELTTTYFKKDPFTI